MGHVAEKIIPDLRKCYFCMQGQHIYIFLIFSKTEKMHLLPFAKVEQKIVNR